MENYFLPTNTKQKQVQNKVHKDINKRKQITNNDNSAEKKIKTANALNL